MKITEFLKNNLLFLDGGMGTILQASGLVAGELPERWNITHPEIITNIHKSYFDAGSNVVNTNTFGANTLKFSEEELEEIIKAAIQNARTSYLGDTLTRDGFHLTIPYGRYIAALTWGKVLTGKSVEGIAYAPEGVDEALKAIAIESVENAVKSPFEVTQSIFVK